MQEKIHYSHCPVCGSTNIHFALNAKDHTVTGESFAIFECRSCTLRFTQDVPGHAAIGSYYKAEAYISHTNTSRGLINRLYQAVRKRTLKQKRKLITKWTGKEKGRILDVGAGTGAFVVTMRTAGWEVTGLEPDSVARKTAMEHFNISLDDVSGFYSLPGTYDAITMWHVLEHVHDLNGYLQKLKQLLAPGGKLFVAVPNYTSEDANAYGEFWAAWDVPRHLYHFSPLAMKTLVEKHGLRIESELPMKFDSYYVSMLSSKYQTGSTKLISSFLTGFRSNRKAAGKPELSSSVIYVIEVV